jgi:murein DD-endopeptidase MepM/ murein hydrolase activator NlpD
MFWSRTKGNRRALTLVVIADASTESRSYRLTSFDAWLALGALIGVIAGGYAAGVATSSHRAEILADSLAAQAEGIRQLSAHIDTVEARYGRIAELLGARETALSDLWPPPVGSSGGQSRSVADAATPTSWPLTERGFVTQALMEGMVGEHPGLDIAVPTGAYIRAAGGGVVAEAGENPLYGHFVVLDHGAGYRSLYAHASTTFVGTGDPVRQNEVIALSGSTGRSTAPHLHFEILKDNEPVDPLTILQLP